MYNYAYNKIDIEYVKHILDLEERRRNDNCIKRLIDRIRNRNRNYHNVGLFHFEIEDLIKKNK